MADMFFATTQEPQEDSFNAWMREQVVVWIGMLAFAAAAAGTWLVAPVVAHYMLVIAGLLAGAVGMHFWVSGMSASCNAWSVHLGALPLFLVGAAGVMEYRWPEYLMARWTDATPATIERVEQTSSLDTFRLQTTAGSLLGQGGALASGDHVSIRRYYFDADHHLLAKGSVCHASGTCATVVERD